jgi:hypothetical protein
MKHLMEFFNTHLAARQRTSCEGFFKKLFGHFSKGSPLARASAMRRASVWEVSSSRMVIGTSLQQTGRTYLNSGTNSLTENPKETTLMTQILLIY